MKKLMKLRRLIDIQKKGSDKKQKQFQVDERLKEQVYNLVAQTNQAQQNSPEKSKGPVINQNMFDNFKFTSLEDFKFMTKRPDEKPVDCASNNFFMHLRSNGFDG
jgi:hypothetical protein